MAGVFAWGECSLLAQQNASSFNENVVFVDAAHGGADAGAHLGGTVEEKDVTLALAGRLRSALAAKGFTVVMSREGDATVTADQRAGVANHVRPVACILLHASASGPGAVLAVSSLNPNLEQRAALPWATAQAGYVSESLALRDVMVGALNERKMKQVAMRASTPPIDSLTCAALTLEVAPGTDGTVTDADYQQKVADGVTQAIVAWKAQVAPAKMSPVPAAGKTTTGALSGGVGTGAPQ